MTFTHVPSQQRYLLICYWAEFPERQVKESQVERDEKNRDKWEAARQLELLRWSVREVCRPYRGRAPTKPIALLWRYEAKLKGKDVQLRARIVADGKHQEDRPE